MKTPRLFWILTWLCMFCLYLPLFCMALESVWDRYKTGEMTLTYYSAIFEDPQLMQALLNSFSIATFTSICSVILGTFGAFLLLNRSKISDCLQILLQIPLLLPDIVIGLSLLLWLVTLKLSLGYFTVTLSHITLVLPYVVIVLLTRLKELDHSLEDAAADLGASPWQTLWRIQLPLLRPAMMVSALLAFTLSFDDFLIAFFTTGPGVETLPIKIYSMIRFGLSPKVNALCSMILLLTAFLITIIFALRQKPRPSS